MDGVSIEGNDSGTDTDAASSVGDTWYDYSIIPGASDEQKAEKLFWAYQRFNGRYRRHMRKPVRRARRFHKRREKVKVSAQDIFSVPYPSLRLSNSSLPWARAARVKVKVKGPRVKAKADAWIPEEPMGRS